MKSIKTVVIVGLGYVGLPLALLADKKGYKTTGLDIDTRKIDSLQAGKSYIDDVSVDELKKTGTIFTTDASVVENADAVIICVPTPVTKDKQPDLTPVKGSLKTIAPFLKPHTLVVLESTVNPGVCDEVVIPLIESLTKMKVSEDLYLAHCPERINPGDPNWNVTNINRVIGANSAPELELTKSLYDSLIDAQIKPMQSLKEAEAVKVVENSFRDINIAFVNELAMSFHKLGINLENVIDGAATKPFAFMPHHPSCGVGGHCIPVDPYYLIEYAHGYGFEHEFLRLARSINDGMPAFTVELLEEALNEIKKPLNGTKVAMLGLSYKANVGDDRESPAYEVKELLEEAGADLVVYDPFITAKSTVKSLEEALEHAEAVVVTAKHKEFLDALTAKKLQESGIAVLVDGNNGLRASKDNFKAAHIIYKGIGV
jgi:UDP-N-acetyl-D-glucosamine dehydrogenase